MSEESTAGQRVALAMSPVVASDVERKSAKLTPTRCWTLLLVMLALVKLGLFNINMGANASPERIAGVARTAETLGFESLWAGEHIVLPDPQAPPSPMAPQDPCIDAVLALTWAAAATSTIRLATGIVILPQRNPLVLAKEVASLDVLSGGRLTLGVGVGYLQPEFAAIGANYDDRGAVTDDFLAAMASLWYDEHPEHHGPFSDFAGIDAYPRPVQQPIPIVIGGHSAPAYRRAVASGHGWYGFAQKPEDTAASIEGLRRAAEQVERAEHLGELEISVTPRVPLTDETVTAFAELGVHRLVPMPRPGATEAHIDALMGDAAAAVLRG